MSINRTLGQKGNTTIPRAIRQKAGFKGGDAIKYTMLGKGKVMVEKICDRCAEQRKRQQEFRELRDFINGMPTEFQRALAYLHSKGEIK